MTKNRLVAAGAAVALATGTALMAAPAHAAAPAPISPIPAPISPAKPNVDKSKLPIQIDFDCLKRNAQERHQIEAKIAKILLKEGAVKAKTVAVKSAKDIVDAVLKDPSLLVHPNALITKIIKIITDNVREAFGDTSALGDLKPLAQDIINNLKAAKACFVINRPGQPPKIQHVGHLGELQGAAWVPAGQVR
ncbi:hypothetical protein FYJ43_10140 [Cutibacterium sp. WCA-380-WT-3A]|uniref:Uncharacterized protein n=1 Tax=Cutibacterium porci TaxID=2605781 RepID=A0A7K0J9D2_9ACTN|nr:hypothetical protein [Cutibacterium porci]MSS46368.1 hypothetical protein [Cutibacterium porci]